MIPREFKGKAREVAQTEGDGGADGIVLPLQVVDTGAYDVAYTIQISVGTNSQALYLQVDTGSSDLWIASKSCSSSVCSQTNGHLYDPSGSNSTGQNFDINYLQGNVSGPIVWDQFVVGGYGITNQALAAANTITNEPLGPLFSGILGLALPLNSIIAELIPPVTSNSPDGAAWASNLFSITPTSAAPSARFLSLLLSRPGSDTVPAQVGIGRHPAYVGDVNATNVEYGTLESEQEGTLFWKVSVRAITVWVNGVEKPVNIGTSNDGSVFPSAVLDTGVPLILTTSAVANGIYGAIGVSPASDGNYYVPCTTPLNLTITLDNRAPITVHPLDLTATTSSPTYCIGLIQAADSVLAQPDSSIGDIILGVPFIRNTYTVMAYEPPNVNGSFDTSDDSAAGDIKPRLGLLGITDPTIALAEFNTVRVLNQPISSGSGSSSSSGGSKSGTAETTVGKHISVGIIVLVSLLGFFALCIGLFGLRWWLTRRRFRRTGEVGSTEGTAAAGGNGAVLAALGSEKDGGYAYALASTKGSRDFSGVKFGSMGAGKELFADEETMRSGRYEPYMQDHGLVDLGLAAKMKENEHEEMGYLTRDQQRRRGSGRDSIWGDETLVGTGAGRGGAVVLGAHERSLSVGVPLLHEIALERTRSGSGSGSGSGSMTGSSMSRRGVDEFGGIVPVVRVPRERIRDDEEEDLDIGGVGVDVVEGTRDSEEENQEGGNRESMVGVGTAARRGSIPPWGEPERTLAPKTGRDPSTATTTDSEGEILFRPASNPRR